MQMHFDPRPLLYQLAGVDLKQFPGIGSYVALRMLAKRGTDTNKWPTAKRFTS
jgi:hypothetical protein